MSRRTLPIRRAGDGVVNGLAQTSEARALAAEAGDVEATVPVSLPRDHPKWQRDRFTISSATKALIDRIKPIAIRVFGFWDHRVHTLSTEQGTIEIDASGAYRCDTSPFAT